VPPALGPKLAATHFCPPHDSLDDGDYGITPVESAASAPVAQLDRASGFEPEGREFESLRARHINQIPSGPRPLRRSRASLAAPRRLARPATPLAAPYPRRAPPSHAPLAESHPCCPPPSHALLAAFRPRRPPVARPCPPDPHAADPVRRRRPDRDRSPAPKPVGVR
jgi:hypothetical protein